MQLARQIGVAVTAFALAMAAGPGTAVAQTGDRADERFSEVDRLSPRQLDDRAMGYLGEMQEMLEHVRRMLEEARAEKDVVKLNCVNEKLTHLRGLVRVSEQSQLTMGEAIAAQETEEARHEFTKILVARDRVRQLRTESEECVGQLAFVIDEALEVDVEVPDGLPDVITDTAPMPPVAVRPPMASPVE
jgi:hypothetical protein